MTTINISIDVLNPQEIVRSKKGFLAGFFASLFLTEKKLKIEIEKRLAEKMIEELRKHIGEGFAKEGVDAKVRYSYEMENNDGNTFI